MGEPKGRKVLWVEVPENEPYSECIITIKEVCVFALFFLFFFNFFLLIMFFFFTLDHHNILKVIKITFFVKKVKILFLVLTYTSEMVAA